MLLAGLTVGEPSLARGQAVEGIVLAATDSSAVPAAMVFLHRITAVAGEVVDSARTDAEGRFSLTIAASDSAPGIVYAAAAVQGGVSYFGPVLHAGVETPTPYRIYVYETESVSEQVDGNAVLYRHAVVSPTAHGLLQVAEVVDVAGVAGRALQREDPGEPIWSMKLPAGVQSWSPLEGGLAPEALSLASGRVEARATLPPNGMRLSFSYYTEGAKIEFPVEHETERFEVILVGAAEEKLSGLTPGENSDLPPGVNAKRFVASDLPPDSRVGLTVQSEPVPRGPVLIWTLIGSALLIAAAVSARVARGSAA
jgi:hypothetical protein